jgi:hypothetical protein
MKKLLLLILLLPIEAFSGLPEEDFAIDAIRDAFKNGTAPTTSRLLPGKLWVCGMYMTTPGQQSATVGVTLGGVKYKTTSEGVMSATTYFTTDVPYKIENDSLASYAIYNQKPFFFHFIREYNHGLIVERAHVSSTPLLPSVINPSLNVNQYSYCLPYEKIDGRKKIFNHPWEKIHN